MVKSNSSVRRTQRECAESFGEKFGLGCDCGGGGFAAGDADDAEHGEGRDSRAGDEDAVGVGAKVGRGKLDAVVEERKKVIGDDTFQNFAVGVAEADPKAVELGSRKERFTFGLEVAIEFADEVERADAV